MPSVTRSTRPGRERRASTARRILDATERLLRDGHRYTEIPVERIIADAGVSRSTFYAQFPDKAALRAELAERGGAEFTAAADQWVREDPSSGPAGVEAVLASMLKVYRRHAVVLQALGEVAAYDDSVRDVWREGAMREVEAAASMIRRHQDEGHVSPDVDPEMTAYAVIQMIQSAIADHVAHGPRRRDRQFLSALARAGWLAIYGRLPSE